MPVACPPPRASVFSSVKGGDGPRRLKMPPWHLPHPRVTTLAQAEGRALTRPFSPGWWLSGQSVGPGRPLMCSPDPHGPAGTQARISQALAPAGLQRPGEEERGAGASPGNRGAPPRRWMGSPAGQGSPLGTCEREWGAVRLGAGRGFQRKGGGRETRGSGSGAGLARAREAEVAVASPGRGGHSSTSPHLPRGRSYGNPPPPRSWPRPGWREAQERW